jgi:mono/diheme cytochrome c family protein
MAIQRGWTRQRLVLTAFAILAVITVLSSFLSSCSDKPAAPAPALDSNEPLSPALVMSLYNTKCALCHGKDGSMKYAGAPDLAISTLNKGEVIGQITYGKGTMPPRKGQLNDQQIEALADYTISLRH